MRVVGCTCTTDWRAVRKALGLSAPKFASAAHISIQSVWNHEYVWPDARHYCWLPSATEAIHTYLLDRAQALVAKGIRYPWPEDLRPVKSTPVPAVICNRCGRDERLHRRCIGCGFLLGDGHAPESATAYLCTTCHDAYAARSFREMAHRFTVGV